MCDINPYLPICIRNNFNELIFLNIYLTKFSYNGITFTIIKLHKNKNIILIHIHKEEIQNSCAPINLHMPI